MRLLIVIILLSSINLFSQTLTSDFLVKSRACLNEQLRTTNLSEGATSFEWDFCPGDLNNLPEVKIFDNPIGAPFKLEFIESNGLYHAFYTTRGVSKLYRLDFGSSVESAPTKIDLGNLGILNFDQIGLLNVSIVKEGDIYYGFILDFYNRVYRFTFGTSLTNSPTNAEVVYNGGLLSNPIDMVFPSDSESKFAFIANSDGERIIRLDFGNSFNALPIANFINIGFGGQGGLSFIKDRDKWYSIISTFSGALIKVYFDAGLSDLNPVITSISGVQFSPSYRGLSIAFDNNSYYVFAQSPTNLYRISFGSSINNNPTESTDLGRFNLFNNVWGFSMFKVKSDWLSFSSENSGSNNIYKIAFPQQCFFNKKFSSDFEPIVTAQSFGDFSITLTVNDLNGNSLTSFKSILISNQQSPDIDFNTANSCANHDLTFTSLNSSSDINNYYWSFGDTQTSADSNPTHQYSSAEDYTVSLQVTADNGCDNYVEKNIKIYDPPSSAFDLPSGLICTNNEFNFANNTIDNFDGNLTYQWLVNDVPQSSTRDFKFSFTEEGDQQIKLITAIPGCSSTLTQTLPSVQTGPAVGFSFTGKCEDEAIAFTNQSAGAVSGYQWDFGNGNTSTQQHPTQTYTDYGNYQVSLITTGTNGCASTITKPIRIYSVPQTNFTIDLPPFACSGSASQFNDITPTMPDSNVATWAWKFGDAAGGTALQKNPLYTYSLPGDYAVELVTTTNAGCSNSVVKSVTIFPSPKADFTFGPACVNQGTSFSDQSTGAIKSWLWSVQGTTYAVKNPIHIFKSSSTYSASLAVTGTNNCINRISKDVVVPVPVVADFTFSSTCAAKPAVFDEINTGGADPARAWKWDFGGLGSSEEQRGIYTFPAVGNFGVKLTTTRQSGCSYSITKTIPIIEPPQAQFAVALEAGAAPFRVDFINKSSGAASYMWKFGDANNTTSTVFSPSFTYEQLGDYTARLTIENALKCSDTFNQLIRVVVPQINAAISGFKMEKAPGADAWTPMVTIENKSNVAIINPEVYLDISGNAQITEKIVKVIKPNSLYTHTFTSAIAPRQVDFACAEIKVNADAYSFDNRQCVSLVDEAISRSPYPNPARDILMVEWISKNTEPMTLTLYNSSGQAILNSIYNPTSRGLNQVAVDVASLPAGIYFASYATGGTTQNFRFSIIR